MKEYVAVYPKDAKLDENGSPTDLKGIVISLGNDEGEAKILYAQAKSTAALPEADNWRFDSILVPDETDDHE